MTPELAIVGAGYVGLPLARCFAEAGVPVAIVVALPTPLSANREPDLSVVLGAVEEIAARLRKGHLVVLESTTYPGTTREDVLPILESAGFEIGTDVFLAFSPERIDPGRE